MLQTLDFKVLNYIQKLRCGFLDFLMPKITALGNGGAVWILAAVVLIIKPNSRNIGSDIITGLLLGVLVCNIILKPLTRRRRPFHCKSDIKLLIKPPTDYSFPSGHTLSSFIAAFILVMSGSALGIPAVVLASLIAFSRLYMYVHFPSDVIGAIVIAAAVAKLTVTI